MKKKLLMFALVLGLLLPISGCGKKETVKIRLNEVTHSVFYAPQYVAINQGFFKEEGLEIELTNGQGADKVMTAVLSSQYSKTWDLCSVQSACEYGNFLIQ